DAWPLKLPASRACHRHRGQGASAGGRCVAIETHANHRIGHLLPAHGASAGGRCVAIETISKVCRRATWTQVAQVRVADAWPLKHLDLGPVVLALAQGAAAQVRVADAWPLKR